MTEDTRELSNVIQIDEAQVRGHLTELIRGSVEKTLNGLLDAEADQLVNANATSEMLNAATREPATTDGSSTLRRAK